MTNNIKVIAFDIFGTVVDLDNVPRNELKEYARILKAPKWEPFRPPITWKTLKAFEDSKEAIKLLRQKYKVVTLSNCPIDYQIDICKHNKLEFDALIPLEAFQMYKPKTEAYKTLFKLFPDVAPSEFMMVTANKTFGDLEGASNLGMSPVWIRHSSKVKDILHLSSLLETGKLEDYEYQEIL